RGTHRLDGHSPRGDDGRRGTLPALHGQPSGSALGARPGPDRAVAPPPVASGADLPGHAQGGERAPERALGRRRRGQTPRGRRGQTPRLDVEILRRVTTRGLTPTGLTSYPAASPVAAAGRRHQAPRGHRRRAAPAAPSCWRARARAAPPWGWSP